MAGCSLVIWNLEVLEQGLECMGMSAAFGLPKPENGMIALIKHACSSGDRPPFLNTSDMYGPHSNKILIGKIYPLSVYPFNSC